MRRKTFKEAACEARTVCKAEESMSTKQLPEKCGGSGGRGANLHDGIIGNEKLYSISVSNDFVQSFPMISIDFVDVTMSD